jgi:serine/threonine-protein kinase
MTAPAAHTPELSPEPDLSGRKLGDYLVVHRLGRGAMAEVYLAEQTSLRRQVAIKVLKASLAGDATYVQRFHNEAQAAASLVHANIVQIHEVGCHDGIHYIAQEYVAGQNLRELLARQRTLDVALVVTIMRQVSLALQKAAERGIVHRDIKPENIMISTAGEVKVADFGLARLTGDGRDLQLTQVGITMGTPLYMSPEQVEGKSLDPRSDLYSLGVTCFHMLTGEPPFRGETALSVAVQHLKTPPERLEELRRDLPPALARIVHKLLAKKPDERYPSPRELLRDLRQVQVPGLDDDAWNESLAVAGLDSLVAPEGPRAADHLAEVMKTSAMVAVDRRTHRRRWLRTLALFAVFGAGAAWVTRDRPLLTRKATADIPKYPAAREQFFVAQMQTTNPEQWLKSVEHYFPNDEFYVLRAQQELARYYLLNHRPGEALAACEKLSRLKEPTHAEFRAFGLAGMAVIYSMQGNHERASQAFAELPPLREKLDGRMAALVGYAFQQNRKALDQRSASDWDDWLKTLPSDAEE